MQLCNFVSHFSKDASCNFIGLLEYGHDEIAGLGATGLIGAQAYDEPYEKSYSLAYSRGAGRGLTYRTGFSPHEPN